MSQTNMSDINVTQGTLNAEKNRCKCRNFEQLRFFLLIYPRFSFRMLETCVIGLKFCTGPLKKVGPTDFFCFFEFRKSPSSTLRKFIEWRWLFLVNIFRISGEVCIMHESSDIMHASSDAPLTRDTKNIDQK